MRVLFQVARHDRVSRGARFALRLIAGLVLVALVLRVALAVLNPGAAILAVWTLLILFSAMRTKQEHDEKIEAGRRETLRDAAVRARDGER